MAAVAMDQGPPAGLTIMESLPQKFDRLGYLILRSAATEGLVNSLQRYMLKFAAESEMREIKEARDGQVPGAISCYGDPVIERLLEGLVPDIEQVTGRRLYPTYGYFRIYKNGDVLRRHRDRPACEFTVSLCIGYQGAANWPIYVQGFEGVCAADLAPGDGLIFKGLECDHWRQPFAGVSASMAFLHYVDRSGPHSEWRFDKRLDLHRVELEARNED